MAKTIIVDEVYKSSDNVMRKKIIRENLIRMIKNMQEKEFTLRV